MYGFLSFEEASNPPASWNLSHIKDHWWLVHPDKGLVFWKGQFPQCNTDRRLFSESWWDSSDQFEIRFVESVFIDNDKTYGSK